ncbi:Hypothetical predicted protein [Paramuricea clavata]|uniref:Uncharacterized protein n=1 Tax=Paramuricea clavata TaxID=317549 RepID=A0A6S7ICY9_PARCT|nr:Hypothetical predicted protein [Paramuricea clavata]
MGIGIAIAAIAVAATVASDVGFGVAEEKKQDELKSALDQAHSAINSANDFYKNVYKIVKTRLEHLKQSMRKLPPNVIAKLNKDLVLNLNNPDKVVEGIGKALGITQTAVGMVGLVTGAFTSAGLAAADSVVATVAEVAGAAGAVLAVAGFGLSLYTGITELNKINDAIDKVNGKRQKAENAMKQMKNSLDGLLKALGITVSSYESLRDISNDWVQLATNFDRYATSFYDAITGFAMGKTQSEVVSFLKQRASVHLKDDVLSLAKLIEENILQMMRGGKNDEQIVNFYAKETPNEGLRFVMESYFVSTLREYAK